MSYPQAYFTSSETGLRGAKGFQISAASPGISARVLEAIERLSTYVPPISMPSQPEGDELLSFPVSLAYERLDEHTAIVSHSVYLGRDYTGRFGNYFTHSLVLGGTSLELTDLRPIELWASAQWARSPVPGTELPPLDGIGCGAEITMARVLEFVSRPNVGEWLPRFLTAGLEAMTSRRRMIIVAPADEVALWVATLSYAMPAHLARFLTFNTYHKSPNRSDFRITGTTPDSDFAGSDYEIESQFFLFDFARKRFSTIPVVSPAASAIASAYRLGDEGLFWEAEKFLSRVAPGMDFSQLNVGWSTFLLLRGHSDASLPLGTLLGWATERADRFTAVELQAMLTVSTADPGAGEILGAVVSFAAVAIPRLHGPDRTRAEAAVVGLAVEQMSRAAQPEATRLHLEPLTGLVGFEGIAQTVDRWREKILSRDTPLENRLALVEYGIRIGLARAEQRTLDQFGASILPHLGRESVRAAVESYAQLGAAAPVLFGMLDLLAAAPQRASREAGVAAMMAGPASALFLVEYLKRTDSQPLLDSYLVLAGGKPHADRVALFSTWALGDARAASNGGSGVVDRVFDSLWLTSEVTLGEAARLLELVPSLPDCATSLPFRFAVRLARALPRDRKGQDGTDLLSALRRYFPEQLDPATSVLYPVLLEDQIARGPAWLTVAPEEIRHLVREVRTLPPQQEERLLQLLGGELACLAPGNQGALLSAAVAAGGDHVHFGYCRANLQNLNAGPRGAVVHLAALIETWARMDSTEAGGVGRSMFDNIGQQYLAKLGGSHSAVARRIPKKSKAAVWWTELAPATYGKWGVLKMIAGALGRMVGPRDRGGAPRGRFRS